MEIAERMTKRARQELQKLVDRAKESVTAKESVREGKTWVEICKAAEEENADVVVIGSHGRTGLSHALIGSVAETVVRHSSCPVLVVRDSGR
jgi:universal stress protein A